jgi:hypothetical protein
LFTLAKILFIITTFNLNHFNKPTPKWYSYNIPVFRL